MVVLSLYLSMVLSCTALLQVSPCIVILARLQLQSLSIGQRVPFGAHSKTWFYSWQKSLVELWYQFLSLLLPVCQACFVSFAQVFLHFFSFPDQFKVCAGLQKCFDWRPVVKSCSSPGALYNILQPEPLFETPCQDPTAVDCSCKRLQNSSRCCC